MNILGQSVWAWTSFRNVCFIFCGNIFLLQNWIIILFSWKCVGYSDVLQFSLENKILSCVGVCGLWQITRRANISIHKSPPQPQSSITIQSNKRIFPFKKIFMTIQQDNNPASIFPWFILILIADRQEMKKRQDQDQDWYFSCVDRICHFDIYYLWNKWWTI